MQYAKVFERLNLLPGSVEHVIVQIGPSLRALSISDTDLYPGVPIAYPRMVFLETALESKLNPLVALGKAGAFLNRFNSQAELLDDLVSSSESRYPFKS